MATAMTTPIISSPSARPIQSGESTHHHYQSIFPSSLSVMNTIARRPAKPIPLDDELDDLLMLFLLGF